MKNLLISSVFFNRLNKNMRLQSDPTVIYAITEGKYRLKRKLTRKDLKLKSIHNTYVNKGLPPKIIGFPGKDSLLSTTLPNKSDLLYFVSKNQGGEHYFSSDYKQHLKNIKASKDEKNRKGLMLVLSSPSGAGKTTICKEILKKNKDLKMSISYTTRPKRKSEVDGKDYFFISEKKFKELQAKGFFY